MILSVPDDVRFRLGAWGGSAPVYVDRLRTRVRTGLSTELAACLALFAGGREHDDAVEAICQLLGVSRAKATEAIVVLRDQDLLRVGPCSAEPHHAAWCAHGWSAAYDYQTATWDYPFVDYDAGGWAEDRQRMDSYGGASPDRSVWAHDRCDDLPSGIRLPSAEESLRSLDSIEDSPNVVSRILSAAFGRLPPHRNGTKPRRSSPSGGARHPSEGYVFALEVPDIPSGIWHVRGGRGDLVYLGSLPTQFWMQERLSGLFLGAFKPTALIVVTSVFERNMYRYREPRTFRTLFLDAGHLLATIELLAAQQGLRTHVHHAIHDAAVEDVLGLNSLQEGVMAGIAIGRRA